MTPPTPSPGLSVGGAYVSKKAISYACQLKQTETAHLSNPSRQPVGTVATKCPASSCKQHECALTRPAYSTAKTTVNNHKPLVTDITRWTSKQHECALPRAAHSTAVTLVLPSSSILLAKQCIFEYDFDVVCSWKSSRRTRHSVGGQHRTKTEEVQV